MRSFRINPFRTTGPLTGPLGMFLGLLCAAGFLAVASLGWAAPAVLLGDVSPAGIGRPGTRTFPETPVIGAGARFIFDLGPTTQVGGGVNDLIEIAGDLNLQNNTIAINPLNGLANGTYRLINYSGAKTGSFSPAVSHQARYVFTLDASTLGQINVVVAGSNQDLRWAGPVGASWDLTTATWVDLGTSSHSRFYQGDAVRFDDSGLYSGAINLDVALFPSKVTVDSSSIHYSLSGAGGLSGLGGGLIKNGSSTLTVGGANDYLGPVQINGGVFRMGSASGLGAPDGGATVADGATLDLGGFSPGSEAINLQGAGVNNAGVVINTGPALINDGLRGAVTLSGNATLGGPNQWDVVSGSLAGGGFKLTKTGPSEIGLIDLGGTALGEIEVQEGVLTIAGTTLPGDPNQSLTVRSNAALSFRSTGPRQLDKPIVMEWAEMRNATPGGLDVTTNIGSVTFSGTNIFNLISNIRLRGEVGGLGGLIKIGSGALALDNDNFYAGDTHIVAGRLILGSEGGVGGSPHLTVESGAILDVSPLAEFRVRGTQNLYGNGTVHGTVLVGSAGHLSPGVKVGSLAITNHLLFEDGSSASFEIGAAPLEGGGVNDLVTVGGNLTVDGTVTIKINPIGALDPSNPYTIIKYAGTLSGDASNLTAGSDARQSFTFDTSTPGKVKVQATGSSQVAQWMGGDPGAATAWDTKLSGNWATTVVPDQFYAGDTAVFNDTGSQFNVALVDDLFPANTRVEANQNDYVFAGDGRIRGGGLSKSFGGKLTLANTGINDYPGPTAINGGTLQVGTGGTVGNLGPGTIVNNGRLILNRSDDLTIGAPISGAGSLYNIGAGNVVLSANNTYQGATVVNQGKLTVTGSIGAGGVAGEVRVQPGSALAGTGAINAPTVIDPNATLSPGLLPGSIGTLTTPAVVTLAGITLIDIARNGGALSHDRVTGATSLNLGGTLTIQASGEPLQNGDTFAIFTASAFAGSFAAVNLPVLPVGLIWDQSRLATSGIIKVVAPPPTLITPVVSGNQLILGANGGAPGAPFRIVASVEVMAPIPTWTQVASGTFNSSGGFSISIPIVPGEPQKFYAVRAP